MMRSHTTTVMECDRCGAKEACDAGQDQHWSKVHAQTLGGSSLVSGFGFDGYNAHLCVACLISMRAWWGSHT